MKISNLLPFLNTPNPMTKSVLGTITALLILALSSFSILSASPAKSPSATFSIVDSTGLPNSHKIYVLGFSSTPGFYLNSDGTWLALPQNPTGQIPCFELGSGTGKIDSVDIDSSQSTLSARVYFFIDDKGTYPACNNGTTSATTGSTNGIFGTANFSYTTNCPTPSTCTYGVTGITQASIGSPNAGIPIYSFSEIGPGPSSGTIDVSQVDLYSFPVTIEASVNSGPSVIGNTLKTISFTDNSAYANYINGLAGAGGCSANPKTFACEYLDLQSPYGNYSALLNPGGFLNANTSAAQSSMLNTAFDTTISKLWAKGAPTITLNNGGPQGGAPQETFVGTSKTMLYPCNAPGTTKKHAKTCPTAQAIEFVGQSSGYIAYVFSPIDYSNGCAKGVISGCPSGSIQSSGNQVFSGSGVFGTTATTEYANLGSTLPSATTQYGAGVYGSQVARLGLIMTQALNHGAFDQCNSPYTWTCLNLQSNWYPTPTSSGSQNLFANFMHTATNSNKVPFFVQPPSAVKSASGTKMGMAYGFSNDEQPTPPVLNAANPEVPSKMDQTVQYGGTGPYTITLGPW